MFDVIIIGSGPAGISTALHLIQHGSRIGQGGFSSWKSPYIRARNFAVGASADLGMEGLNALGLSIDVPFFPSPRTALTLRTAIFTH